MTQIEQAWGAGPSARYEALAEPFRPLFEKIRAGAVKREIERKLPHDEIGWLKDAGFTRLRVPNEEGGSGATLPEFFNLLIELSQADSNLTQALRAHFGFTEDILNSTVAPWREAWLKRIARGETIGSGFSEVGDAKLDSFSTRLTRKGGKLRVNGEKYYTTGTLYADWINLGAADDDGKPVGALVSRQASGVEVLDDWEGFGQTLTASGTARFSDAAVDPEQVHPSATRFRYATAFLQLVHLATLAGIGRAAAEDVASLVRTRKRVYSHGNAAAAAQDPQILQVVGNVRSHAYAAGAIVLKAAEALQRAYEARLQGESAQEEAGSIADVEIDQAVPVVTDLILNAVTHLFDALGSSATQRKTLALDRYWRNARTLASHNPRVYRSRLVGDFAINGTKPPAFYRVGQA